MSRPKKVPSKNAKGIEVEVRQRLERLEAERRTLQRVLDALEGKRAVLIGRVENTDTMTDRAIKFQTSSSGGYMSVPVNK